MRLALLSDLHFGRAQPDLVQPLLDALAETGPDHIVIAGDFVQRARPGQFRRAREFVDRLCAPWIAVPGNHDIPLFNVVARVICPRQCYRRWIARETEPMVETGAAVIVGLDTTHRWSRQRGKVSADQIDRVAQIIRRNAPRRAVIVAAHHPFHQAADVEKKLMLGAPGALETWAESGPHVILTGHLHRWLVEPFVSRKNKSATLQVHCGTGLSTRRRGEPNEFAVLDVAPDTIRIRRMVAHRENLEYRQTAQWVFGAEGESWVERETSGPAAQ